MKNSGHRRRAFVVSVMLAVAAIAPVQAATGGSSASAAEVTSDACGQIVAKPDGSAWACSFFDEFNGRSLDAAKWGVQETAVTGFRSGLTCYSASDKNIRVRGGALELVALKLPGRSTCSSPSGDFTTPYTGAMIGTRGRFSQTYGKFEVRAAFPTARTSGVHGAFWMNPLWQTYGAWPHSGEIDIAEWWSSDPTLALPSLHYAGRDPLLDSGWDCRVTDPSEYHTYTLDWQPTGLSFFIDGTLCFTRAPEPDAPLAAPAPFDHPFSMILSVGVGGPTGFNAVDGSTPLPATYRVDYVKAWH